MNMPWLTFLIATDFPGMRADTDSGAPSMQLRYADKYADGNVRIHNHFQGNLLLLFFLLHTIAH